MTLIDQFEKEMVFYDNSKIKASNWLKNMGPAI